MIDLFETRELTQTVNQLYTSKNFLTKMFFKNVAEPTAEHIDVEIVKGKRRLAPFVSPKIAGKVVTSLGKTLNTYKPAYIKDKRVFEADDAIKATNVVYVGQSTPAQRLAEKITKELADQADMIDRRIEFMVSEALTTGAVNVKGEGIEDVVDFGMAGEQKVTLTGTALWTDAESDPRANLKTWVRARTKASGVKPNVVVMGADVIDAYVNHAKVKDTLDTRRIDMGMIDPQQLPDGAVYYGYDKEIGVDIYTYDDWYVSEDDGLEYPFMPVDKIILGSTNAKTVLAFGMIKDLDALYASKMFTKSFTQDDPSARFLLTQSAPLPIPTQIEAFMCNKVV